MLEKPSFENNFFLSKFEILKQIFYSWPFIGIAVYEIDHFILSNSLIFIFFFLSLEMRLEESEKNYQSGQNVYSLFFTRFVGNTYTDFSTKLEKKKRLKD